MKLFNLLFGIILLVLSFVIMGIGWSEEVVVGETLCVDGQNRINLEGIMCEKTEATFFGNDKILGFLMIIPALFGFWLFVEEIMGVDLEELEDE